MLIQAPSWRHVVSAVVTVAALAGSVATPASAEAATPKPGDSASLGRSLQVTAGPTGGLASACVSRSIYLVRNAKDRHGYYWDMNWGTDGLGLQAILGEDIDLDTATYSWVFCLHPENGIGNYILASSLTRSGHSTYRLPNLVIHLAGGHDNEPIMGIDSDLVYLPGHFAEA